jgi:hypothetical protein
LGRVAVEPVIGFFSRSVRRLRADFQRADDQRIEGRQVPLCAKEGLTASIIPYLPLCVFRYELGATAADS